MFTHSSTAKEEVKSSVARTIEWGHCVSFGLLVYGIIILCSLEIRPSCSIRFSTNNLPDSRGFFVVDQ